jgi:hypothetical protein
LRKLKTLLKSRWTWAMLAGTAVFVALFAYATPYVNGTDQYWHINYIDSILKGVSTSNELYPAFVLDPAWNGSLTGFIHNMPVLYIWALFAWATGSLFHGAMLFNALAAVLSAWFVYLAVRNETTHAHGAAAYLITLLFPLAFWQSVQLLTEISAMLFLCAGVYLIGKKGLAPVLSGAAVLALAANSRTNALLLALLLLVFAAVRTMKRSGLSRGQKALLLISPTLVFAVGYIGLGALFGPTLDFTVSRTTLDRLAIVSTFDQTNNMALHYSLQHFSDIGFWPMVGNLFGKLKDALIIQFGWTGAPSVLYWLHNLLFLAAAITVAALSRREKKSVFRYDAFWVLAITAVSWAVSSAVYQNQFRYNLVYMPLLAAALCVGLHRLGVSGGRRFALVALASVLLFVGLDAALAYTARTDAISEHAEYTADQEILDGAIPAYSRVVMISPTSSLLWPQLLYPRVTTVIDPAYSYTDDQMTTLMLGRYVPNEYIVTAHGALDEFQAYRDMVDRYFTPSGTDGPFDFYRRSE